MASLAEIRAKLKEQENRSSNTSSGGGDNSIYPFWNIKEGESATLRFLPDGNADFTRNMGMLVSKGNLGFGNRSWRYAMVVDDGVVEWMTVEPGQKSNATDDPYGMTSPEELLKYLTRYAEKRPVNF